MKNHPIDDVMPAEIDFSKAVRGLHHIPPDTKIFLPPPSRRACGSISPARPHSRASSFRRS